MTIEQAILDFLKALDGLSAVGTNMFWGLAPQGIASPYIVPSRAAGRETSAHDGPDDLGTMRLQVDCYADTAAQSVTFRKVIIDALKGKSITTGGFSLTAIDHINSFDRIEPEAYAGDARFRAVSEFLIQYITT